MRTYSRILIVTTIALALICTCVVSAQYSSNVTTPVTVPASGQITVDQSATTGVVFDLVGTPGSAGSVTAAVYTENPQPNAAAPSGVSLTHYVVVSFDIAPENFTSATITIHYTDDEIAGLTLPIALYKYIPETNAFIELPTVMDTAAKTLSITLYSTTDPLFAIGGASAEPTASPTPEPEPGDSTWIIAAVVAVVVVLLIIFILIRKKIIKL